MMFNWIKKIFKRKSVNRFKTAEESEYIAKKEACLFMINKYSEPIDQRLYHLLNTYPLQEYNTEQVERYQQELLALEANKLLGNIK